MEANAILPIAACRVSTMIIRIHERSPLLLLFPRWVSAFVFGRRIFLRGRYREVGGETVRHELIHAYQYAEYGILPFLWRYFWTERRLPYREKSFEREAYAHQHDPDYLTRRWPDLEMDVRAPADRHR